MKKQIAPHLLAVIFLGCLLFRVSAQESIGIEPYSSSKPFQKKYGERAPAMLNLIPPNLNKIRAEDASRAWLRFATEIPVRIDIAQSGEWLQLSNGDRIWRLTIRAKGARGLLLSYAAFQLPAEGLLHIYNKEKTQVLGAFSNFNNRDGGRYATAMIAGEELTLEYYEPAFCRGQAELVIDGVGYAYRSPIEARSNCDDIDINCPEGDDWQDEKRGVLGIEMKFTNGDWVWCNGALMNNTAQNKIPYVLTSYSSMMGSLLADAEPVFEEFVFDFNWENKVCGGAFPIPHPDRAKMIGCTMVASNLFTDMLLLRINGAIPYTPYNPYYLGCNRSSDWPTSPVCIHIPENLFKKIASSNSLATAPQGVVQSPYMTYPSSYFQQVFWNMGQTMEGSQGAPLLDNNGYVVGTVLLTGNCDDKKATASKLFRVWSPVNVLNTAKLSPWLDPTGSNVTTLEGLEGGCGNNNFNGPVADLDKAVLGKLSAFISKELRGNYKMLEQAYIRHQREIDLALTSDEPKYEKVQAALETLKEKLGQTFFRAFIFEKENVIAAEDLAAWRHFIQELSEVVGSTSFTKDMQKINHLLEVVTGKDLKSALIAFDRASLSQTSAVDTPTLPGQLHTALIGNPGIVTTLQYDLPENGHIAISLFDLSGTARRTLLSQQADSGSHSLVIDKRGLPSGVYFVRCVFTGSLGQSQSVQKLVVQ